MRSTSLRPPEARPLAAGLVPVLIGLDLDLLDPLGNVVGLLVALWSWLDLLAVWSPPRLRVVGSLGFVFFSVCHTP